jgi:hypothetical protein
VLGRVDESEADQVVRGVARIVAGIAPGVGLELAAVRARDVDLITVPGELPVGMCELGPPETDRPSCLLRFGWVRRDEDDALGSFGIEDVEGSGDGANLVSPTLSATPNRCRSRRIRYRSRV